MSEPLEISTPHDLIRAYSRSAKKQFGQHFLSDPSILGRIASLAKLGPSDRVLEIGPGCGTLTWVMLERQAQVTAVEIDAQAAAFLAERLAPAAPGLTLVQADALRVRWDELLGQAHEPRWKVVANLPYNVATAVFFALTQHHERFELMTLMFQREVALRMVATVQERSDYGSLSLMTALYYQAQLVMSLPPGAFMPAPKVHSAVVHLVPVPGTRIPDEAVRERFVQLVKVAFQSRRKTILNGLRTLGLEREAAQATLDAAGVGAQLRPEQIPFEGFVALASVLAKR